MSYGLVGKQADEADRHRFIYKLTPRGKSLRKVLLPLTRWSLENIPGTRIPPESRKSSSHSRSSQAAAPPS